MIGITYNLGIPDGPNNPSADQPNMKINNDAIYTIWARDHVTFNTDNSGTHAKVTYLGKNPPAAPSGATAITYTNDGLANATHPQLYYRSSQGTFPLSGVRAFGTFTGVAGSGPATAVVLENGANVASITKTASDIYRVTLSSSTIVNSNNVIVLLTVNNPSRSAGYTFTNPNLDIQVSSLVNIGLIVNFLVLQI